MKPGLAVAFLLLASLLEAGGDALVRKGLDAKTWAWRALWLAVGGLVLFGYGYFVNAPRWDFGRLLGIYVAFFFLVAQGINYFAFHQRPVLPVIVGGALIISGGFVIALWKP